MKDQKVRKLAFSGMTIAVYVVLMYLTQSISFGAYQIRIATALYALSWPFPFLALPLALANMLSNLLFGGMGILDIAGGFLIGIMTTLTINLFKRSRLPRAWSRRRGAAKIPCSPSSARRDTTSLPSPSESR